MVEAMRYLKTLEGNDGTKKWPLYSSKGKLGYIEAFIKREIEYIRKNELRRTRVESSRNGGQRLVKREEE
jgi:hypothetical protein